MNAREEHEFVVRLSALSEYFDKPISAPALEIYTRGLSDVPFDLLMGAMNQAVKTCTFMPKVAELRTLALGSSEDAAEAAWGEMMLEVAHVGHWGEPNLPPASLQAIQSLGGWHRMCQIPIEGPERLGWKKQWNSAYEASARTERRLEAGPDRPDELPPSREDARAILARIQAGRK